MIERSAGWGQKLSPIDVLGILLIREEIGTGACNLKMAEEVIKRSQNEGIKARLTEVVNRFKEVRNDSKV
jgi:hypothetical protein